MNGSRNWGKIKKEVLGDAYDLSVAFVTDQQSGHNVLSYPLSPLSGEILINKKLARRDGYTPVELFIHGLLHLKGYDHGSRMEGEERKLIKRFTSNGPPHRRRT